jgi:hypothetical protein
LTTDVTLGGAHSTRNWDGYTDYSLEGERQWSGALDAGEFYCRPMEKVMSALQEIARLLNTSETRQWRRETNYV